MGENTKEELGIHRKSLRRQVRREGGNESVRTEEADAYLASRARDSQLSEWASDQSRPLASRALFESRFQEQRQRFEGQPVPRPPHWSGYRVVPDVIEFWNDRAHRLHERRLFTRTAGGWTESRSEERRGGKECVSTCSSRWST